MIPGIVLAAGNSSRMGRPKALLTLDRGDTFLARVVTTLLDAGVGDIVVVVGADAPVIRHSVERLSLPVRVVDNPAPQQGQLSSLVRGLDAIDGASVSAALVTLIDVPLVSVNTVRVLLEHYRSDAPLIARPASRGRHGHPVIFHPDLFDEFRRADVKEGAKQVLRAHSNDILDVEVADEGAFTDIDTPEQYERLSKGPRPL